MKTTIVFIIALVLATAEGDRRLNSENTITAEEYEIYSALLKDRKQSGNRNNETRIVVVNDQTIVPDKSCSFDRISDPKKKTSGDELKSLAEDLMKKSIESKLLAEQFKISGNLVLLSKQEFSAIFKGRPTKGWEGFYEKYPGSSGYITFSRVGLNSDKTKALLYRAMGCGSLCGSGGYVFLQKEDGEWKIVDSTTCWVS